MEEFVLFLLSFLLVFLLYQIIIVNREKKNYKKKDKKEPIEVLYLVRRYRLDLDKISYNQLLQIIALVSSFDIACVVSIIMFFKNFWLELGVGFLSIFLLIEISYYFVYLFYKKKGMIRNE